MIVEASKLDLHKIINRKVSFKLSKRASQVANVIFICIKHCVAKYYLLPMYMQRDMERCMSGAHEEHVCVHFDFRSLFNTAETQICGRGRVRLRWKECFHFLGVLIKSDIKRREAYKMYILHFVKLELVLFVKNDEGTEWVRRRRCVE